MVDGCILVENRISEVKYTKYMFKNNED